MYPLVFSENKPNAWLEASRTLWLSYRILLSTIVCDIAVLLVLVVAISCLAFWRFWETIRVIYFIDDSLGVER